MRASQDGYQLIPIAILASLASVYLILLCMRMAGSFRSGRRVVLTGGGTGGHVYPALAIGAALDDGHTKILYIGVRGKAEAALVPREGYEIKFVRASAFAGLRPSAASLSFIVNTAIGSLQALIHLGIFQPQTVIGTGGYAAAPVFFAAATLRMLGLSGARFYIHEQNAVPGKLNGLVGRFADVVFLSFPETMSLFPKKGMVTGYPVRGTMVKLSREESLEGLGLRIPEGRKTVFVFGGSQGARSINRAVVEALGHLALLRDKLFIVHGTGLKRVGAYDGEADVDGWLKLLYREEELSEFGGFYHHQPYFHDIQAAYSVCDLVVCRAGAGSLNEISSMGLPAVIVPKAGLPGDHQVMNARSLACSGGALLLYEEAAIEGGEIREKLSGKALAEAIAGLVTAPGRLLEMSDKMRGSMGEGAAVAIAAVVGGRKPELGDAGDAGLASRSGILMGNGALMIALGSQELAAGPPGGDGVSLVGSSDLGYYRARASALLSSRSWPARNMGVKQIGMLKDAGKLPLLLHLLADRKPAPAIERFFGGDYRQVGFVRRNIVRSIGQIGVVNGDVEAALMQALSDPYYEVRVEAAKVISAFGGRLDSRGAFENALRSLLSDSNHEVAAAAAGALGMIGKGKAAADSLLSLRDHHFWQVRQAGLRGLRSLVERGEADDPRDILERASKFILTSTDFRPHFTVKESFRLLAGAVAERAGE